MILTAIKNYSIVNKVMFVPPTLSYKDEDDLLYIQINDNIEICCILYEYVNNDMNISVKKYKRALSNLPIIVICHGNACDIGHMKYMAQQLCRVVQCHVLLMEYPGYGMSSNIQPTEENTGLAIEKTIDFLYHNLGVRISDIILYGQSIGSRIASHGLQYCYRKYNTYAGGLVLISPYLSVKELVGDMITTIGIPIINRFTTKENITHCKKTRVFIMHGEQDEIIPVKHGKQLAQIASSCSEFQVIQNFPPNATHNSFNQDEDIFRYVGEIVTRINESRDVEHPYCNLDNIMWNRQLPEIKKPHLFVNYAYCLIASSAEFTTCSAIVILYFVTHFFYNFHETCKKFFE